MKNDLQIIKDINSRVLTVRGQFVLLDRDLAEFYGVETRDINKAVKNNTDKFPNEFILELDEYEKNKLVENFHRLDPLKHSVAMPKAFTERGLYMLATIIKSKQATKTTIAIIDTFVKLREAARAAAELPNAKNDAEKADFAQKSAGVLAALLAEQMPVIGTETSIELNLSVIKVKHTIKRGIK